MAKYLDITDIFSKKLVILLLKYSSINNYTISLKIDKQLFYKLIYSLELVKLEIVKTYIKNNLTNSLIKLFKSFTRALILLESQIVAFTYKLVTKILII